MALPPAAITVDNGTVLMLITVLSLPIAAIAFARSGGAWREIGKGRFGIEQELPEAGSPQPGPNQSVDPAMQAAEARQMLEAKSYRRQQRGEAPLDVELELRRLFDEAAAPRSGPDPELRAEVRRLVMARNERRLRRGQPPLDVEAETERQLADLVGSS